MSKTRKGSTQKVDQPAELSKTRLGKGSQKSQASFEIHKIKRGIGVSQDSFSILKKSSKVKIKKQKNPKTVKEKEEKGNKRLRKLKKVKESSSSDSQPGEKQNQPQPEHQNDNQDFGQASEIPNPQKKEKRDENDSFMNEKYPQQQEQEEVQIGKEASPSKEQKSQNEERPKQNYFDEQSDNIVLFGEVSEEQQQQQSESANNRNKNKNKKKKINKNKKVQRKGRGKQKILESKAIESKKRTLGLDDDLILIQRNRPLQRVRYKETETTPLTPSKKQKKAKLTDIEKDTKKIERAQQAVIASVLSSGFNGPYRYYQVALCNGNTVFVKEKDMRRYFPRKLNEFYEKLLNMSFKSTNKQNLIL